MAKSIMEVCGCECVWEYDFIPVLMPLSLSLSSMPSPLSHCLARLLWASVFHLAFSCELRP